MEANNQDSSFSPKLVKALYPVVAIVAVTAIEISAISHGMDGTLLFLAYSAVAGLAGYNVHKFREGKLEGEKGE